MAKNAKSNKGAMIAAIYVRVSSRSQDHRAQQADLERWAAAHETPVRFYRDVASGKTMERPAWSKLWADVQAGQIGTLVVWRLDRLGRTAKGLTALFEDLQRLGIGLVSLRDGLDLDTPAGRLMANVLASVAAYETEVRSERQRAGIEAARAAGKTWGGRTPGARSKSTVERADAVVALRQSGLSIAAVARMTKLSRPTIYSLLTPKVP